MTYRAATALWLLLIGFLGFEPAAGQPSSTAGTTSDIKCHEGLSTCAKAPPGGEGEVAKPYKDLEKAQCSAYNLFEGAIRMMVAGDKDTAGGELVEARAKYVKAVGEL
ncbi:MAG: hypothetical protein GY953_55595, partial [bacterium]|nr:hypothetical protein [bacterium]